MKKIINKPEDAVRESLEGMAVAHSDIIRVHFDPDFVYRIDAPVHNNIPPDMYLVTVDNGLNYLASDLL